MLLKKLEIVPSVTLNNACRLYYWVCECACAVNLRYAGVAQILQAMQSSVGTSAKCIATMKHYHYLTISWVATARHKRYAFT